MKIEQTLAKKYRKELSFFKEQAKTFREQWLAMLHDLTNVSESNWDFNDIRYSTVMTQKQWKEFAYHAKRRQYKSKIKSLPRAYNKKFEFIKKVLKDCCTYYTKLRHSKYKTNLKLSIRSLLDCALNARYSTEILRICDRYFGRTTTQRDNGEIDPTTISLKKLDYAIFEYSRFSDKNYTRLKSKIYKLCNGRVSLLLEYYYSYNISRQLRNDLRGIFRVYRRDQTLSFMNIKLGWEVWKTIREIGLDVDKFLHFNGFPGHSVIKKKLLSFLNNPTFVTETLQHMKDELPECYDKYKKQGHIYRHELLAEESIRKNRPKRIKSMKQTQKMIIESKTKIYKYFPLAKKQTPTNILLNPIHPASTSRAFQSTTKNIAGESVRVIVMTPRWEQKDKYLPTLAHEVTHLVHRMVLDRAEKAKLIPKGTNETIPSSVQEDFSQLVEHQFRKDTTLPYRKKFHGSEFADFSGASVTRAQVSYALSQLGIRTYFDKLYDRGYKDELSEEMLLDLKDKYNPKVKKWDTTGINIIREGLTAFKLFSPQDPDDGLVYMKRYIVAPKTKTSTKTKENQSKKIDMSQAFKKRFGKEWIKSHEARSILLWLLLESGRNPKTEEFGATILTKKPKECKKELKRIGITDNNI
ncbi:MAG: hypothetical protein U9Q67_00060 [Patescibacteria group bacterium]|nr:hypothetical protein [Patescibacteria group bacterium]